MSAAGHTLVVPDIQTVKRLSMCQLNSIHGGPSDGRKRRSHYGNCGRPARVEAAKRVKRRRKFYSNVAAQGRIDLLIQKQILVGGVVTDYSADFARGSFRVQATRIGIEG
jgi:hypothetical protein